MDFTSTQLAAIFLIGLFFSGLFSMLEAAVISQDKHRLLSIANEGDRRAIVMRDLLARPDKLLSALLLCNNLANISCAAAATTFAVNRLGNNEVALPLVTLLVTFIILIFCEISPKVIGIKYAAAIARAAALPLRSLIWILSPFILVTNYLSSKITALFKVDDHNMGAFETLSIKEVLSIVRSAGRQQAADADLGRHYSMLEKTLRFNDLAVEKIMTPRQNIYSIDLQQDETAIAAQVRAADHSKLPIADGNIDQAKGVVDTFQALKSIRDDRLSAARLQEIAQPLPFIPAAAAAMRQLQDLKQDTQRMALVVNGAGRVIGMVTFANFAAAIIGDEDPPDWNYRPDGAVLVDASMNVLEMAELFPGLPLPETDAVSVNGMILEYLGDLPDTPVCMDIDGWRIETINSDGKSVLKVAILPPR